MTHELILAFPNDDWAHEAANFVGSLAAREANQDFTRQILTKMRALTTMLEICDESAEHFPNKEIQALDDAWSKASSTHFKSKEGQEAVEACLQSFTKGDVCRFSSVWSPCVGTMVELLAFRPCVEAEVVDTLGMKVRIANVAC